MLDVCLSENRALALSQHDCREGPTVKVPVIIPNWAMLLSMKGKMTASLLKRAKKVNVVLWQAKPSGGLLCGVCQRCNIQTRVGHLHDKIFLTFE